MTTKVCVVTGAARGIGAATARRLVREQMAVAVVDLVHADAQVVVDEIVASGARAVAVEADVSDEDAVARAVERVVDQLGPPTVLVNNAGIIRDDLVHKMTVNGWDRVMHVHLRGAFLMTRAVQSHMVTAGWGRIVNLSSTSALGKRGQANYAAAKAGLQGLTKTLALELGPFGITANAVAPGFIETEMTEATAARIGVPFDQFARETAEAIPVRRSGRPDDVANAIAFFASEESGFVSGQVLYVAGGPKC